MKKFILFRHDETDLNAKKIFQGCGVDADLNENGRQQALELKEVLKPYKIQCVYTSPLKRAVSTASLAFDETMPITKVESLREACLGEAEGTPQKEVIAKYPEVWKWWYTPNEHMEVRYPGGESKQEIGDRIKEALLNIAAVEAADTIGISTHSAAIRCFLMPLGREDKPMKNCEVYVVEFDGKDFKLLK